MAPCRSQSPATGMATLATILDDTGLHVGGAGIDGAGVGTAIVAGRRLARQITSKEEEK